MNIRDIKTQNYIQNGITVSKSLVDERESKRQDNLFFLVISFIACSLMLVIIILNTFVFFIADVSGSSMHPTLSHGDKLLTNRCKEIEIDTIVTIRINTENGEQLWIKRVIALGGDEVEIKNGKVYVNGALKVEPYVEEGVKTESIKDGENYGYEPVRWKLEEDEVFFLGDNRKHNGSMDARAVGPCKINDIVGVIEEWTIKK